MKDTRLEKRKVCPYCFDDPSVIRDCSCYEEKYKPIELEFEVCIHCNHDIDPGNPAKTIFNKQQLNILKARK